MNNLTCVIQALVLWIIVFLSSSYAGYLIGSKIFSRDNSFIGIGFVTQVFFIASTLLISTKLNIINTDMFIVTAYTLKQIIIVSALSMILSYTINKASNMYGIQDSPRIYPDKDNQIGGVFPYIVLLILAPVGEELLFRGLLEGYLIQCYCHQIVIVLLPAFLFSIIHFKPLNSNIFLLFMVFIIGLILSYSRLVSGSLVPAIIGHSTVNLSNIIYNKILVNENISSGASIE